MKKRTRYARAKLIKKKTQEEENEEPTIIKLDTSKLPILIGTLITSLIILILTIIEIIETFL